MQTKNKFIFNCRVFEPLLIARFNGSIVSNSLKGGA